MKKMITKNNINFNFGQTVGGLNPYVRNLIEDYVDSFLKNSHVVFGRKYLRKLLVKYYVSFVFDLGDFGAGKNLPIKDFENGKAE